MIDIHCHLLPFTDDGPRSWEDAYAMCELAIQNGISHIVATPHCNSRYRFDRSAAQEKVDHLASRFPALGVSIGCEFTLGPSNLDAIASCPDHFTIGDTGYILVELSDVLRPRQNEEGLQELIGLGLKPVLAHVERNTLFRKHPSLFEDWISMGCISTVTGNSLTGFFGHEIRALTEKFLKRGWVDCIVSDGHDPVRRPPVLSGAVAAASRLIGLVAAQRLVKENPERIVAGSPIP